MIAADFPLLCAASDEGWGVFLGQFAHSDDGTWSGQQLMYAFRARLVDSQIENFMWKGCSEGKRLRECYVRKKYGNTSCTPLAHQFFHFWKERMEALELIVQGGT